MGFQGLLNCIIRWELACGEPAWLCLAGSSQLSVVLFKPSRVSLCSSASALLAAGSIPSVSPEAPHCASFSLSSDSSALKVQSHCIGCVCAVLNWNEHIPWSPELWEVHVEAVALCKVCVCMAGINMPINIPTWSWAAPAGVILGCCCLALSSPLGGENRRLCREPVWLPGASLSLGLPNAKATLKFLYQRLPSAGVFAFPSVSAGSL